MRLESNEEDKKSLNYILRSLIAGGLAGCAAKTIVAPFDRVKILFQTSHKSYLSYQGSFIGYFKAIDSVHSQNGLRGLFQGHSATLLRIFPYAGIKFMMYEQFKAYIMPDKQRQTGARKFVAGSLAGCTAVILTYPFDLVRVRLAFETSAPKKGIWEICKIIYAEPLPRQFMSWSRLVVVPVEPIQFLNFYRGIVPSVLGMVPYAGVSFYSYESLKEVAQSIDMFKKDGKSSIPPKLSHFATLLCGGVSGLLAQTCSYPFEVVRRHMQVAARSSDPNAYSTMWRTTREIVEKRGVRGLFVGLGIGYLKIIPMFAVSFYTYEQAKVLLKITHVYKK